MDKDARFMLTEHIMPYFGDIIFILHLSVLLRDFPHNIVSDFFIPQYRFRLIYRQMLM